MDNFQVHVDRGLQGHIKAFYLCLLNDAVSTLNKKELNGVMINE
jgi:hypothetical protein